MEAVQAISGANVLGSIIDVANLAKDLKYPICSGTVSEILLDNDEDVVEAHVENTELIGKYLSNVSLTTITN